MPAYAGMTFYWRRTYETDIEFCAAADCDQRSWISGSQLQRFLSQMPH
jgi:hypothetical protein